jgi:hypothetical protein
MQNAIGFGGSLLIAGGSIGALATCKGAEEVL